MDATQREVAQKLETLERKLNENYKRYDEQRAELQCCVDRAIHLEHDKAELEKRAAEQEIVIAKMKARIDGMEFVLNRLGNPVWQTPVDFC